MLQWGDLGSLKFLFTFYLAGFFTVAVAWQNLPAISQNMVASVHNRSGIREFVEVSGHNLESSQT